MTIKEIFKEFDTTPFLFVGSGISRRYLKLPDWKGLLKHFADITGEDEFAYSRYENKVKELSKPAGEMPLIAQLIQHDFDEKWFKDSSVRKVEDNLRNKIKDDGLSPFKAEMATYLMSIAEVDHSHDKEIKKLSEISEKNISGVITTNYDNFLENHFYGYKPYIGQSELIFSPIQGVGEIYKIHGSVNRPESMIINQDDYLRFEDDEPYLAAKLLTIFMEYPIVFLGYSLSDRNIRNILKSVVHCLNDNQIRKLASRLVFVEYKPGLSAPECAEYSLDFGDSKLDMRRIILSDFMPLYDVIAEKKNKIPARVLRHLKTELYEFTLTSMPTDHIRVMDIDNIGISDDDLVLSIGKETGEYGLKGLLGISGYEWYKTILFDNSRYTADDLLKYAFESLKSQNSGKLPVHKLLFMAKEEYPEISEYAKSQTFENIISNSIKKIRQKTNDKYKSVQEIWSKESDDPGRATRLISQLYDYLKWGKEKSR